MTNAFEQVGPLAGSSRMNMLPPDTEPLTESERHIVTLLVQGKTNRVIAGELYMSKRSLESQLTQIFRKLGVRRKSEIRRDT